MSEDVMVLDLGEVEAPTRRTVRPSSRSAEPVRISPAARAERAARVMVRPRWPEMASNLSLFLPGAGQAARGDVALGLFFLSSAGFLVALGWAVVATLNRLAATLEFLGLPGTVTLWCLVGIYGAAVGLYLGNVTSAASIRQARPHPALTALASAALPGWGQFLNRDRVRSALFLAGLWLVAASWFLVSPQAQSLLDSQGLFLPREVRLFCSPIVRFTLPSVIWSLAVYDAATSALAHRRQEPSIWRRKTA